MGFAFWALGLGVGGTVLTSSADPNATYRQFQSMSPAHLAQVQVKLTYVGPTEEPVKSVAFAQTDNPVNIAVFRPFYRNRMPYGGDLIAGAVTFAVSPAEMRSVIDSVANCPEVTQGLVAPRFLVSFALYSPEHAGLVFESVVGETLATCLFRALRGALASNEEGLALVTSLGCAAGSVGTLRPSELTGCVSAKLSGFRLDHSSERFVTEVTVKNDSTASVGGPLTLVFEYLTAGYEIFRPTCETCALGPKGRDCVVLKPPGGVLAPGASMKAKLEFDNPDRQKIQTRIQVYAGPGSY